ncbi:MFS transporter [Salsuginibacillus kocurii]|uniref:MFS transporter n=1 Tax=Salsuginibacillus kocurii TaxID=427078 RepID=UPI0003A3A6A4|nr:MFS transporter [Salsuginibacillus kocurii]
MAVTVGLCLAAAAFINSAVFGPILMFIGFFMLRLFGQGSMTLVPNTLVPQWFSKYRGRAISFMTLGVLISAAALPPLNLFLIETGGWRFAWQVWGILLLVVFVPLAFIFIRNKPEDVGLLADNEGKGKSAAEKSEAAVLAEEKKRVASFTVKEAMKTKSFWFVLFCAAVPSLVNTGITFHLFSILGEKGISRTYIAFLLSLMPVSAFLFTLISGFIVERVQTRLLFSSLFLLKTMIVIWLILTESLIGITLYVILWGVFDGATKLCNNVIWPNYFGLTHLGQLRSLATTSVVVGSALGPLPFGYAFDFFGSYTEILLATAMLTLLAMVLAFAAKPPLKKPHYSL